jgi:hypothetical protein
LEPCSANATFRPPPNATKSSVCNTLKRLAPPLRGQRA